MDELKHLTRHEYGLIAGLVLEKFGINLGDKKQALVAGRLNKVLKENGFVNFKDYYSYIISDLSGEGLNTLINRLSTNHTYFYREHIHLEYFSKTVLPMLKEFYRASKNIRVWSCGCSSGEEAYVLAMLMNDFFESEKKEKSYAILGTDISEFALAKAKAGKYTMENVSRLPVSLKHKYFTIVEKNVYQVNDAILNKVLFRRLNLVRNIFPFKKKFHTVFCRNVMIYFNQALRENLLEKIARVMEPYSYLFIGLSESINRKNKYFKYIQPGIYQKIGK